MLLVKFLCLIHINQSYESLVRKVVLLRKIEDKIIVFQM